MNALSVTSYIHCHLNLSSVPSTSRARLIGMNAIHSTLDSNGRGQRKHHATSIKADSGKRKNLGNPQLNALHYFLFLCADVSLALRGNRWR